VLRGSGCRSGSFHKFCIGWFSGVDESLSIESRESFILHLKFSVCEPNGLPLVASLFDFKPCSKHAGDS
jgi:hypothetical protein